MERILVFIKKIIPKPIFNFFSPYYHLLLVFFGALIYGFPSRSMKVVGVTGTSGKTTTVEFLHTIFQEAGYKTASLSGLRFKIMDNEEPNLLKMTMPGRFKVQKFLREAKKAGSEYVFIEVTSEGIKQFRHRFIKFYAAIFTNLSEEHLESHGGFENYRAAKAELFKAAPIHVLNGDDPNFDFFNRIPAKQKIVFREKDFSRDLEINLAGKFNRLNAIAAIAFAVSEGIQLETAKKAVAKVKVLPGRMEFLDTNRDFKVLVDYAFLPQTLRKVYETLKGEGYKNLICVTGAAGGGRDKWKRPIIGDVADEFCKKVFVTNEDPYDEDPMQIINEVVDGHDNFEKVLDRREAINKALKSASGGDVVVITGKGAEPWIVSSHGRKISWDDRRVVREELLKL